MSGTTEIVVGGHEAGVKGFTSQVIQAAADRLSRHGGGTIRLTPGRFLVSAPIRLTSQTGLIGAGSQTILEKCVGAASPLALDADYGELQVTVADPSGFAPDMGVQILDDDNASGWAVTTSVVRAVEGNTLFIDDHLLRDYRSDRGGSVSNACSIVSAVEATDVLVARLAIDGAAGANQFINGCRAGGIYLHKAKRCRVDTVAIQAFNGDGISWQITEDITVTRCKVTGCANSGLHPGTGSARSLVRDCDVRGNGVYGMYVCWRVREGRFERNAFCDNGRDGISIGHRDTDNLFVENTFGGNTVAGIRFRRERTDNAPHRNRFISNRIEGNGTGIVVDGPANALVFMDNIVTDPVCDDHDAVRLQGVQHEKN